jgi:hypothetical protein
VNTLFTLLFWLQSSVGLWLSLFALTALIPSLVTRDRASNALTVYLARPLTSADYLLGKFGVVVAILVLLWTGPLLFTWLLGVLFAADRDFLIYSLAPLLRALAFNGIALIALSALALGVSALARTARTTVVAWLGLWLVAGFIAEAPNMPVGLRRMSFTHDLVEIRQEALRVDRALTEAGESLPLTSRQFAQNLATAGKRAAAADLPGSIAGLAVLTGLSSLVFFRRLRPE